MTVPPIELPLSGNYAEIDPVLWAQALAPFVAGLIQPQSSCGGVVIGVQQAVLEPASSSIGPSEVFAAAPGFSITRTMQAGSRSLLSVRGAVNLQYSIGDICRFTLLRRIGGGNFIDLTPSGMDAIANVRSLSPDEVRNFAFEWLDDPAIAEVTEVTYQLAVRSKNGPAWLGRRFDAASSMRSATTITLTEFAG